MEIDIPYLRQLWIARLAYYTGPTHPMAIADFLLSVAMDAGVLPRQDGTLPACVEGASTLVATMIVTDALRATLMTSDAPRSCTYLADTVIKALTANGFSVVPPVRSHDDPLTPMQREVLRLTAEGHTYDQVAVILAIQSTTVSHYLKEARARLGARTTAQAVAMACVRNLLGSALTPRSLAAA